MDKPVQIDEPILDPWENRDGLGWEWVRLLKIAAKIRPRLYAVLHGLRCAGCGLARNANGSPKLDLEPTLAPMGMTRAQIGAQWIKALEPDLRRALEELDQECKR